MMVPLVIDAGSYMTRVGFAGDDKPRDVFPTIVGRIRHAMVLSKMEFLGKPIYFGKEAKEKRGILIMKRPIESGIVTNWDDMEQLLDFVFQENLKVEPENQGLLLTEAPLNPVVNREKTTEVIFEKFKIPYFYLGARPVLALLATGRKTGIVLHSGCAVTQAIPVYGGHHVRHACTHVFVGGDDVTYGLRTHGFEFLSNASSDYDYIRDFKEKHCYVVDNLEAEINKNLPKKSFEMPDGIMINLGKELYSCTERLFQSDSDENNVIQKCLHNAIMKSRFDEDYPKSFLYKNILLSGGNTMFKGFANRLKKELVSLAQEPVDVEIIAPLNRDELSWIGGSVLASSANFCDELCVSKADYEEHGPHFISKMCF